MNGWRRLKRLVPLLSAISIAISSLAACATTIPIFATDREAEAAAESGTGPPAACRAWRAITYSRHDTAETQRQIRGNNAARAGYGCPP